METAARGEDPAFGHGAVQGRCDGSGGHRGKSLPHILFGECVSAARSQSFYPVCNAHSFTHLFYLLAKIDKFCIISQVNGKYLDAVSEVIGRGGYYIK